jgi:hypothetical protein
MKIKIAHLYPELLNLYGDRGNVIVLKNRLKWRGIECEVAEIGQGDNINFADFDIIFLGGGSDGELEIVAQNLRNVRDELKAFIENDGVVLAICGGYELLGKLDILNIQTERGEKRLIGNIAIKTDFLDKPVVGFENHAGITRINGMEPLGKVIFGRGNNGEDGCEGVRYRNVFATYLHGPLLPKNPHLCDYILKTAIRHKEPEFALETLDDALEWDANVFASDLGVK